MSRNLLLAAALLGAYGVPAVRSEPVIRIHHCEPWPALRIARQPRVKSWRAGSRHTNRNIRRARALADGRKPLVVQSRAYARELEKLDRAHAAVRRLA